MSTPTVV